VEQGAATNRRRLAIVTAGLLLFSIAVPPVLLKLTALWHSEFALKADLGEPLCLSSGYCFRFTGSRIERTGSALRVPLRIEGVSNVYDLAKELDEGHLRAMVSAPGIAAPKIVPNYHLYFNVDEAARRIGAFLEFDRLLTEPIGIAFQHRDEASPQHVLDIGRRDIGSFGTALVAMGDPQTVRLMFALLIALLVAATCTLESRAAGRWSFGPHAFTILFFLRLVAITAAGRIPAPATHTAVVLLILLPWLAIPVLLPGGRDRVAMLSSPARPAGAWPAPLWRADCGTSRLSPVELGMLALSLAVFASMLWFGSSFRWSIFEERDLLEARQLVATGTIPVYGPELLLGGHTIGSGLYLLLAPLVAFWKQPEALHALNKLLFVGMPLALWWGIREWTGPAGALFAVFTLVAAERIVALSYWPIHPNFSLFFAVVYAGAVLRGAVAGRRGWSIASGLLLGCLLQLHFSYFLLVPCHVLLMLFGNGDQGRWTKTLAVAAVVVPTAPFLAIDALQGFPNIAQIVQRPRFHSDYPNAPFENTRLLPLLFDWLRQVQGPLSVGLATVTMLLIGLGIAVGIGSIVTAAEPEDRGMTAPFAVTILFGIPLVELTLLGMGYNSRHTIALVPAIFMLAGFGFTALRNLAQPAKEWMAVAAILPLLAVLGVRAADSTQMTRIVRSEGEWAVDYNSRQDIAVDLAARLGVTPETYAKRTFWWWIGWSVDPAIYSETYRRVVSAGAPESRLQPDDYVLVTAAAELPPFLKAVFVSKSSHPVGGMHVHVATPKPGPASVPPSSNADTGVRLNRFLQDVDLLRDRQDGFARIGHQELGNTKRDLFFGSLAQGQIKLLVTVERSENQDRQQLRWCVDSPSLNGHYQEIKTVWRPRLGLRQEHSAPIEARLAGDVLGSLPYKTPACGAVSTKRPGAWTMQFAIDGLFDQSFMMRPELQHRQWPLEFEGPIRNIQLARQGITDWLNSRLDR
jgi:hypothetical protein